MITEFKWEDYLDNRERKMNEYRAMFDNTTKDANTVHSFINAYAITKSSISLLRRYRDKFDDEKREYWKSVIEERSAEMKSILER